MKLDAEAMEKAWAAVVGEDIAPMCPTASFTRHDLADAITAYLSARRERLPDEVRECVKRLESHADYLARLSPRSSIEETYIKDARTAARLLTESALVEDWEPIENAPRDSRSRLVWCPERKNTYVVSWIDNGHDEPGWHHFGGCGGRLLETPTKFRRLPAPPSDKE